MLKFHSFSVENKRYIGSQIVLLYSIKFDKPAEVEIWIHHLPGHLVSTHSTTGSKLLHF